MSIYERMMGLDPDPLRGLQIHAFMSAMQEYMLGNMTGAQATAAFALTPAEQAEATALRDRLLLEASTTNGIQRRLKGLEFENVLILAQAGVAPYTTVAAVKARLGVT